jgi:hypothetical protein
MKMRRVGNKLIEDKRKFYTFSYQLGFVETKAVTEEEAKSHIEKCLGTKLRRAA